MFEVFSAIHSRVPQPQSTAGFSLALAVKPESSTIAGWVSRLARRRFNLYGDVSLRRQKSRAVDGKSLQSKGFGFKRRQNRIALDLTANQRVLTASRDVVLLVGVPFYLWPTRAEFAGPFARGVGFAV